MADIEAIKRVLAESVEEDGFDLGMIHINELEKLGADIWKAKQVDYETPIPAPPTCVFCNAPWAPEMVRLVEQSGYCDTCSDAEQVINVFCTSCTRLVYRKEVYRSY